MTEIDGGWFKGHKPKKPVTIAESEEKPKHPPSEASPDDKPPQALEPEHSPQKPAPEWPH